MNSCSLFCDFSPSLETFKKVPFFAPTPTFWKMSKEFSLVQTSMNIKRCDNFKKKDFSKKFKLLCDE
jgi:hypothetical protein